MTFFKLTKLSQGQNMMNFPFEEYLIVLKETDRKELLGPGKQAEEFSLENRKENIQRITLLTIFHIISKKILFQ